MLEKIAAVQDAFATNLKRLVCCHASALNILNMRLLCILHQDLIFHPYKLQVQALKDTKRKVYVEPPENITFLQQKIYEKKI